MAPRKKQPEREPRRKRGTGAIRFKRGRSLPYEAAFPIGGDDYRYDYFVTRSEAAAHLDRLVKERDSDDAPRNIAGGSQRVDAFLGQWLSSKRGRVKDKTYESYRYYCELAVDVIGARRIDSLDRPDADDLLYYFFARGFKNVNEMRVVLNQAFQYAEDEGYIRKNPFKKVKAPTVEHREAQALTRAQRDNLLRCAAIEDDPRVPLQPIWHLYARLGFRKGEGIGIRWADVNWQKKTIAITQQFTNVGNETIKSTPKTKRSKRVLPLPDDILDMLIAHRTAQQERANGDASWEGHTHGLIFCTEHGGPLPYWHISERWKKLRKRAALPDDIRLHDLRHTALFLMEQDGVTQSVRQAIGGHASATMATKYADHADMDAMRAAIKGTG
jgi:integrase